MIIFALENIRSVYNVGSIFRTAEGFGFLDFALVGITPTPLDKIGNKRKDFIKTALGSEDRVKWEYFESTQALLEKYNDFKVCALEIAPDAEDISKLRDQINTNENYVFVFGSEVDGVSKEVLDKAVHTYMIPMNGIKESFNVSVAAGICMYLLSLKNSL